MSRTTFALVLLVAVLAGTPSPAGATHDTLSVLLPGNALDGSRLFAQKGCIACHSVHGVGGTAGPDLGRGMLNRPLLDIAAVMWNHAPEMERVFQEHHVTRPTFEPPQMASLLAFLYYLGSLDPPGNAERGATLFREKGCQGCHSLGGAGGRVGPALDRYSAYASALYLTTALWSHGRAMAAAMESRHVTRPTFQGNDIPDLLAYIRSAGGRAERVYATPGNPKRGEALFVEKRCGECHAVQGHGGHVGPDLGVQVKGSLTRIAGAMWNHGPRMWAKMAERGIAVPTFTAEEMSDLISYVYFFQFLDPPGDPRRGLAVYKEKRCGGCHEAVGTKIGAPSFASIATQLRTPVEVITAMWNHAGRMTEVMLAENVAWPVLKTGEMADLVAYLLRSADVTGSTARAAGPRAGESRTEAKSKR